FLGVVEEDVVVVFLAHRDAGRERHRRFPGLLQALRIGEWAQELRERGVRHRENGHGGDDRQRPSTQAKDAHVPLAIAGGTPMIAFLAVLSGYRAASARADSGGAALASRSRRRRPSSS